MVVVGGDLPSYTPPKFNIAPERWWLEDNFLIGKANFLGAMLNFRGALRKNSPEKQIQDSWTEPGDPPHYLLMEQKKHPAAVYMVGFRKCQAVGLGISGSFGPGAVRFLLGTFPKICQNVG